MGQFISAKLTNRVLNCCSGHACHVLWFVWFLHRVAFWLLMIFYLAQFFMLGYDGCGDIFWVSMQSVAGVTSPLSCTYPGDRCLNVVRKAAIQTIRSRQGDLSLAAIRPGFLSRGKSYLSISWAALWAVADPDWGLLGHGGHVWREWWTASSPFSSLLALMEPHTTVRRRDESLPMLVSRWIVDVSTSWPAVTVRAAFWGVYIIYGCYDRLLMTSVKDRHL